VTGGKRHSVDFLDRQGDAKPGEKGKINKLRAPRKSLRERWRAGKKKGLVRKGANGVLGSECPSRKTPCQGGGGGGVYRR